MTEEDKVREDIREIFSVHQNQYANGDVWKRHVVDDLVQMIGLKEATLSADDHLLYVLNKMNEHINLLINSEKITLNSMKANLISIRGYINGVADLIRGRSINGLPSASRNDEPTGDDTGGQDDKDTGDGEDSRGHEENNKSQES